MRYLLLLTLAILLVIAYGHQSAGAAGFVVNSTGDGADASIGDGVCDAGAGACTLRSAIQEANASPAADDITFNIPGSGVHVISPSSELPAIDQPGNLDATTQPGFAGKPVVQLDGATAGTNANGITITGGSSSVRGFSITGFEQHGILLLSAPADTIQGNFIGLKPDGVTSRGNGIGSTGGDGIRIDQAAPTGNTIGGIQAADRNVIAGNLGSGIGTVTANGNVIAGNYIGTDYTGTVDLGNDVGIALGNPDTGNTIGGTSPGAGNLISGNDHGAIMFFASNDNTIQGNLIGTDIGGSSALPNGGTDAVWLYYANANTIGGSAPGARNLISGNDGNGITLWSSDANTVQGNYIGTDSSGLFPLGNIGIGVYLYAMSGYPEGTGNLIGGTVSGQGNLIAYNGSAVFVPPGGAGVVVQEGAHGNPIRGNSIHDNAARAIENWAGALELDPPVITTLGPLTGTSLPDCTIDIYSDSSDEGRVYYGSTTADGTGNWTYSGAVGGPNVTATCTDAAGNTSEFSAPFASGCALSDADCDGIAYASDNCPSMPNPSQLDADADGYGDACDSGPSGDVDCSGSANSIDALKVLRHNASLLVQQGEPCTNIGVLLISGWKRGDVNCSANVNAVDALLILRTGASLSVSLPAGCPPIKDP